MTYSVRIKESAVKDLEIYPGWTVKELAELLMAWRKIRLSGVPLRGALRRLRRLRVGDYRIIYEVERSELLVYVIRISHRREAYRGL